MVGDLFQPISEKAPCGEALESDPVYDDIKKARRSDPPEHKVVIRLATEALSKRSKDLWVAVWLTDSLIRLQGFAGLQLGLQLLNTMIGSFWDGLYPRPENGNLEERAAPLDWFGNYLELARQSSPVLSVRCIPITANGLDLIQYQESRGKEPSITPKDFEASVETTPKAFYKQLAADVVGCIESLQQLDSVCKDKSRFGRTSSGFYKLQSALEESRTAVSTFLAKKLEKEPDPVASSVEQTPTVKLTDVVSATENLFPPANNSSTSFAGEISGLEPQSPAEAVARIAAAARYLQRREPANPVPYLVIRAIRWGELRAHAPELNGLILSAPSSELRTRVKNMAAAGRWAEVLEQTETAVAEECGRAWLDLQRYAIVACEKLGHLAVARAIKSELGCLLADYPGLVKAVLSDDTGAANPETTVWLSDQLRPKDR